MSFVTKANAFTHCYHSLNEFVTRNVLYPLNYLVTLEIVIVRKYLSGKANVGKICAGMILASGLGRA